MKEANLKHSQAARTAIIVAVILARTPDAFAGVSANTGGFVWGTSITGTGYAQGFAYCSARENDGDDMSPVTMQWDPCQLIAPDGVVDQGSTGVVTITPYVVASVTLGGAGACGNWYAPGKFKVSTMPGWDITIGGSTPLVMQGDCSSSS